MVVAQGKSSDILRQLYGDIKKYQTMLAPYQDNLVSKYPNPNLKKYFSSINKKIIAIMPMVFCESLLLDLGQKVNKKDLVALGLHMLAISTHDDVVDEMPENRTELAALVYAGNIASNEGSKILIQQGKTKVAEVLLMMINQNHYYQQHVIETLWQHKPISFKNYRSGINHICVFSAIGLIYALALTNKLALKKRIQDFADGYGVSLQLIDDLREVEEDRKFGYWSFPIIEGEPYKKSFEQLFLHIELCKRSLPPEWKNMHKIVEKLENYIKNICQ
ncbi:MAG: class 1 isoprenoid biosynthesis enzyme [Candidatus Daviesbacteria bacterium]|nr:class 1 isoprenoid biosynthesis enzyme [Candidatus Daviesbacteria bacterium]